MKIKNVLEMTMQTKQLQDSTTKSLSDALIWTCKNAEEYGYIDRKLVKCYQQDKNITLAIVNDDACTSLISGDAIDVFDKRMFQLRVMFSLPDYRNIGDIVRLLYFVKHHLNLHIIGFGVQSPEGIKFFDSLNSKRQFKMSWINTDTGETAPYSEIEGKRGINVTPWRIVLESDNINERFRLERWRADPLNMWYDVIQDHDYQYFEQL